MAGFDFSNISGESFGDIEDVFFKKDGKSFNTETQPSDRKVNLQDLSKSIAEKSNQLTREQNNSASTSGTVINISADVIGSEEDVRITLTEQEERRMNTSSVRNKEFIDVNTGEIVIIIEKTEMYNGTNLYTVKQENGKMITYPRSMFLSRTKQFVPKDFYIREAERALEDSIDKFNSLILDLIHENKNLNETDDGKYLELMLDTPLEIIGGMKVPDKVQIPVKRMFDMDYKILMLENVICLDNKIASLLFIDIWF